ncbi:hypothetical protein EV200_103466 [Pedobacter psychrotolerans]|uniref:Secreted protein n=1 Tax=Pedobacter psychrotolerans TaxID=1843235 RepID=A0A4R2HF61_9SPHI|nr:hypothetical protein [Pedobacter psychrotolerans]TCO27132.1 hypothetical protein EV200_103466 [Pedobacter psychrotolerans]GGE59153.1 hypothetical protein GCM10011413_27010 [Pedobacter psychrotolerans]
MFIPLFIAMLLGFVNPSTTSSTNGATTTINATNATSEDPGDQPPSDDTGGEHGHMPPPKIN